MNLSTYKKILSKTYTIPEGTDAREYINALCQCFDKKIAGDFGVSLKDVTDSFNYTVNLTTGEVTINNKTTNNNDYGNF